MVYLGGDPSKNREGMRTVKQDGQESVRRTDLQLLPGRDEKAEVILSDGSP